MKPSLLKFNIDYESLEVSLQGNSPEILIDISGIVYLPADLNIDFEKAPRLNLEVSAKNIDGYLYLGKTSFNLANNMIRKLTSFDKVFSFEKKAFLNLEIVSISVQLSISDKLDGEMGLGAQIESGTFMSSTFPLKLFIGETDE